MIKLVAFDVDGTLRDRDEMPESTRAAVRRLKERGILPVLCTGRSEHEMASLREELGIDWAVTCNGAHIGFRGETVFGTAFPRETVRGWLKEAGRAGHTVMLYAAEKMYINRADCPFFRQAQREIGFMEPLLLEPGEEAPETYQGIIYCTEAEEAGYIGERRDSLYVHRWRTWAVDLNPAGVNKAVGLKRLLAHLGWTAENAAAFGDGLNDLEMIEAVGCGIAMGNAVEALKARARHVTETLADGGIAHAVDRWILG